MATGRLGGKALTSELRKLANEATTITDDGTPVTREQQLAVMIWRQALGWTEDTRDEMGNAVTKKHPPVAWCQQFLFERMEGKAPVASTENDGGMKAADKVRQLAKDRINALSIAKAGVGGPPKHKPKSA